MVLASLLQEWLQTEKRVVVIHRLHQILEPFMLRRQVQDVESRLPEKVCLFELIIVKAQLASSRLHRTSAVQTTIVGLCRLILSMLCAQVAVVVKCAMTPYQSVIYNWVKVGADRTAEAGCECAAQCVWPRTRAGEISMFLSICCPDCR